MRMSNSGRAGADSITARSNIAAIVVAYHPDIAQLAALLKSVQPQTAHCFIVNNGSDDLPSRLALHAIDTRQLDIIDMGGNRGVGAAHNAGIAAARKAGATHVLLLDQDSVPAPDMVDKLINALAVRPNAAAAGPRYREERQRNRRSPFVRLQGLRLKRRACSTKHSVLPVDFLISSGCLIPMPVLDRVGGMRENLFIDYVDVEWGLRAQHHGLQCYGVCAAEMQHHMGDHMLKFFGRSMVLHQPFRHYYLFRNALLLYREAWIPLNWKLASGWHLLLKYGFYTLFASPRLEHFRMMSLGILHGLQGRSGRLDSP